MQSFAGIVGTLSWPSGETVAQVGCYPIAPRLSTTLKRTVIADYYFAPAARAKIHHPETSAGSCNFDVSIFRGK